MSRAGWSVSTGAAVALAATVARTILGVKAGASFGLDLQKIRLSFDGVTAGNVPCLVELCAATFASQPPGTQSTSVTPVQNYGRATTAGFTAARSWVASNEPTVLTVIEELLITPNSSTYPYDWPLGTSPDTALGEGFALRLTAPNAVNARATMLVERC